MKTIKEAKQLSETEKAVADYLESIGVKFIAHAAGAGLNRDGWECDGWRVEFFRSGGFNDGVRVISNREQFDYYTGVGLRVLPGNGKPPSWGNVQSPRELARWRKKNAKPFAPCAADVLYSLLLDASARDECFADWCDNHGFDSDSIKALNTYNACCENAERMARVFTREQIEKLSELLQDY